MNELEAIFPELVSLVNQKLKSAGLTHLGVQQIAFVERTDVEVKRIDELKDESRNRNIRGVEPQRHDILDEVCNPVCRIDPKTKLRVCECKK